MPGFTVTAVEPGLMHAAIRMRMGLIRLTYRGTARLVESDKPSGMLVIEAEGQETKGAGSASAVIRIAVADAGNTTLVAVRTTLNVTGKPAQFGQPVVQQLTTRMIGQFAASLSAGIASDPPSRTVTRVGSPPGFHGRTEIAAPAQRAPEDAVPASGTGPGPARQLDQADDASAALRAIVTDYGPQTLSDPALMSSLLADLVPGAPGIARLLIAAAQDRVADKLRDHASQGLDHGTAIRLTASAFADGNLFAPDACAWVVGSIADALGLT